MMIGVLMEENARIMLMVVGGAVQDIPTGTAALLD